MDPKPNLVASVVPDEDDAPAKDTSDDNLALQFAAEYGDRVRYTPELKSWYVWDGARWRYDNTNATFFNCRCMLRKIATKTYKNAYNKLYDPNLSIDEGPKARAQRRNDAKNKAMSAVKPLKSYRKLDGVLRMASNDRQLTVRPDQWDGTNAKMLFNTPIGTINLRTGEMHAPQQRDYITKMAKVSPSSMATPYWEKFLNEACAGDTELIRYIQRVFGYCLTGDTSEQTLFFCHGPTGTGKSVITNAISYAMGEYRYDTSEGTFSSGTVDRHTQDIARLANARFVTAQETEAGGRWNESRIKRLTGQDRITARLMRQNDFEYTPQMKIFIIGNHKPSLSNVDDAIRRRFHLIPFMAQVPRENMNKQLGDLLEKEAAGILQWMIAGCLEWQRIGLSPPKSIMDATEKYLYEEDHIAAWIDENCELRGNLFTKTGDLYADWKRWAYGSDIQPGGKAMFSTYLEMRSTTLGIRKHRKSTGPGFNGIVLKPKESKNGRDSND